jgi:hypothetical protein
MGKWVSSTALNAALDSIRTANTINVTNTQPATGTEAGTFNLSSTTASFSATQAGTGTSARKFTIYQHTNVPVVASGTAQHVNLYNGATLYYVTTCTSQYLTSGNTVTIPTWSVEFADPTP